MFYKRIVSKTVRNEEGVKKFTGVNDFEPVQLRSVGIQLFS